MTKIPFNPQGNIFRWGPIPGKFLYICTFVEVHYKQFPAKYGERWGETLELFRNGNILWLNDTDDLEAAGQRVFTKYMLTQSVREEIYTEWQQDLAAMLDVIKTIQETSLSAVPNAELGALWQKFIDTFIQFWITGSVPELGNYGSVKSLREQLQNFVPENKLNHALEILTAPEQMSFYQEEELALLKTNNLSKHQQEFFWLKNGYGGTEVLPVEFFAERKKQLSESLEQEIINRLRDSKARKKELQAQFNLSEDVMNMALALSRGIEWQDERKKYIFQIIHYLDLLVHEVARRFDYDFEELHNLWHYQVKEIIAGQDLREELRKRANGFGVRFFLECEDLYEKEVNEFWDLYATEKITTGIAEVEGIVASKGNGTTRGRIHILLDPHSVENFKDGEILVAPMTSPEYIFAMKKASAIITDTGGLTSHAAIVSRELGIPCLVNTKFATQIFKNQDLVEVSISKGTARIVI